MKEGDTFVSHRNNTSRCIRGNITCYTSNVMYVISCRVRGIQYVGETRTSLKRRFYGYRFTVNAKKLDTPVGHHFNLPNHSITDMILQGIESLGTRPDTVRDSREKMWMRRLRTTKPHGLNIQEGNDQFFYFIFQHISLYISRFTYFLLLLFVLFLVCSCCLVSCSPIFFCTYSSYIFPTFPPTPLVFPVSSILSLHLLPLLIFSHPSFFFTGIGLFLARSFACYGFNPPLDISSPLFGPCHILRYCFPHPLTHCS